jgi:hypothetical protein
LFNTFVLNTPDLKSTGQAKDANAALLTLEQATTEYHQLGVPSDLVPSTIPQGATVASLFKLMASDPSVSFNFCATLLTQAKISMMENHATGVFSTWPLFVFQVLPNSIEALVATDMQRAAGVMAGVCMLLSHTAFDIEAT